LAAPKRIASFQYFQRNSGKEGRAAHAPKQSPQSNPARTSTEFECPLMADTVEKLDFLPLSQFLSQQVGFKKKALRGRQKV
jgi:hypothetical protein